MAKNCSGAGANTRFHQVMTQGLDLYNSHFGLDDRPFSLVPDPDFLFWSPAHKRAYAMLEYGLHTGAPITLITGEVGAGKTTLVHHLLRQLPDDVTIGYVSNSQPGRMDLLHWIMVAFDLHVPDGVGCVEMVRRIQDHVIAEYASGRRVVIIFDEAQNLDRIALEELRMLTNINANKDQLLQLVLVGQPELREMVRQPDMAQFAQRVASSFHLTAMDSETVAAYLSHRLRISGATRDLFTPDASDLVFRATRGIPRLVNQLADLSLVYAATDERKDVGKDTVCAVLKDGVFFSDILLLERRAS